MGANLTVGSTLNTNTYISNKPTVDSAPVIEIDFTRGMVDTIQTARNSNATTVAANGKIVIVSANTPRVEYSLTTSACLGLVCEEARTNLCGFSDIEGLVGGYVRGMVAAGPDAQQPRVSNEVWIGPNRTSARHTWVEGGDNNVGYMGVIPSNPAVNSIWTASVYVYLPSTSSVTSCGVTFESGTVVFSPNITGSANVSIRDQWQRIVCQGYVTGGSGFATPVLRIQPIGAVVFSDCWQIEQGEYASTWIPTTNVSSATRAEDYNFIRVANNVITPQNMSVYVEGAPKWSANVLMSTANNSGYSINSNRGMLHLGTDTVPLSQFGGEPYYGYGIQVRSGNATDAVSWGSRGLSNTTYGSAVSGAAPSLSISNAGYSTHVANTTLKVVAVANTSLSRVGINGSQTSIANNASFTSLYQTIFETFPLNRIVLGYQAQGGVGPLTFGGHIKRFALYPRLLSNTEIIALTET